ncbi:MAG: serine hydrolase domain-containing protein [Chitinophagaceae bacterium]
MKKMLLFLLTTGILLFSCKKGTDLPKDPEGYDFSAVEQVLNDSVPSKFNGKCYAVITVNGSIAYEKGYGGYDGNTRQLIASCSKWLSGAVLMSQVDEGKIRLSDTVGKFLPIFTTYGKGNITIAQLFSHTSGFPGNSSQGYESDVTLTLEEAVNLIAKNVALINPPGTKFYYGGVSMQVAGRICEVVSGKSWTNLLKDKITTPCGMTDTDFGLTQNPIIAGGGRSTPYDYTKLLIMLMNKGIASNGTRVLSEAGVTAMEQNQLGGATVAYSPYPTSMINTTGIYGIGNWRDLTTTGDVLVENSSPGAFGSHPWIDRNKKVTGIIFTYIPIDGYIATMFTCLKVRGLVRGIVN